MRDSGFIGAISETKEGGPVMKFRFGIPGVVKPLKGNEYKALYKDAVVWPGTPAAKTLERLANAGYNLAPGSKIVIDYEEKGKEWEDSTTGKVRVDSYLDVWAIRLDSSGKKNDETKQSSRSEEPQAQPTHLGTGGVNLEGLM